MGIAPIVLVVDDDAAVRAAVALAVRSLGLECVTAGSANEALELIHAHAFDIVITDYGMPGMSGLQLIEKIKAGFPGSKSILMTGSMSQEASRCSAADALLRKPFSSDVLQESILRLVPHGKDWSSAPRPSPQSHDQEA